MSLRTEPEHREQPVSDRVASLALRERTADPDEEDLVEGDLVVIAPGPSTGKTRVLEAIAFAKEVLSPTAQRTN